MSSYDVAFDESFSSALAYKSQPYSGAMAILLDVTYTPCATSSREKTGNIITFAQFEEGDILTKTRNNAEKRRWLFNYATNTEQRIHGCHGFWR